MTALEKTDDRRRFPRAPASYDVQIVAADDRDMGSYVPGRLRNISQEGLCLESAFDAPVGALMSVSIDHGGHDSLLLVKVMWRDGTCYGLEIKHWSYLDPLLEIELAKRKKPISDAAREDRAQRLPHGFGDSLLAFDGGMNPISLI
jgi:hypothetical protein